MSILFKLIGLFTDSKKQLLAETRKVIINQLDSSINSRQLESLYKYILEKGINSDIDNFFKSVIGENNINKVKQFLNDLEIKLTQECIIKLKREIIGTIMAPIKDDYILSVEEEIKIRIYLILLDIGLTKKENININKSRKYAPFAYGTFKPIESDYYLQKKEALYFKTEAYYLADDGSKDKGEILLTNKRLIFKGNYETITTALDKILDCKLYKDGIAIDRGTRQRLYYKYKGDQFLFALLFANLKNYGTDYGKIDKMELINRLHNDTNAFMKSSEEKQPEDVAHLTTRKGSLQTANNSQSSQIQGLAKVAGMKDLKKVLEKDVLGVLNNPELFQRYRLTIPNGILLYGPPGCGKTFIARQLAEELGYYFVEIIPSAVGSTYIHQTSLLIRDIFEKAAAKAPSVIFIDEFDALVPSRADLQSADQYKSEEVNEFLAHLNACAEKKIFVIAATNEPGKIDPAIKRTGRLDKLIYVGPPDLEARVEMLRLHLEGRPLEGDIEFSSIAKVLEGFSASDIKYLIDEAARDALAKGSPISTALIMEARNRVPPSVTKKDEERYKSFASRG